MPEAALIFEQYVLKMMLGKIFHATLSFEEQPEYLKTAADWLIYWNVPLRLLEDVVNHQGLLGYYWAFWWNIIMSKIYISTFTIWVGGN